MVYFIGAGPGAKDLITVRGKELLEKADVVIYAGSLVNEELLEYCKENVEIHNSAKMTLEEVLAVMKKAEHDKKITVRLHTGDPCLYGAVREQMDELDKLGILYKSVPGVSSFCGAAASLNLEYTLPDVSQTVIITRLEGRTAVPEKEKLSLLAQHKASLVLFLSSGMTEKVQEVLLDAGIPSETPTALVYKATWEDEKRVICTLGSLAQSAKENKISKTALIIVGDVVSHSNYSRSKLYDPSFTTEFRKGSSMENSNVLE